MKRRGFLGVALGAVLAPRLPLEAAPATASPVKLEAVSIRVSACPGESALLDSGGLCAPLSPFYDIPSFATDRPIRDALPSFTTPRGGVA